eukprot:m.71983 g.71983  ORF g.71983 m.71983 type:complete len:182 (+) comp12294_c0_seq1:85-630(+)
MASLSQHGMEYIGSSYKGDHVNGRMEGIGVYNFPNGTEYRGEMKDGQFHGKGTLYFASGGKYEAEWRNGKAVGPQPARGEYTFKDGLKFDEQDWSYCDEDDRRFYTERLEGIPAAGESKLTNSGYVEKIPAGTYDVGDGFFDPKKNEIYNYKGDKRLRVPTMEEGKRIMATCRYEQDVNPS